MSSFEEIWAEYNRSEQHYQKWLEARRVKYNIPCLGYQGPSTTDGPGEFNCEYENAPDCDHCVVNGGGINPITGKRVYKKKDGAE